MELLESRQLLSAIHSLVDLATLQATPAVSSLAATSARHDGVVTDNRITGLLPGQIVTAYGTSQIRVDNAPATGAGQTIAIVDAYNDTTLAADLSVFDKQFSLPAADLSITSQTGATTGLPGTDAGWARETALDVEWAHATAPAAKILLVEADSSSLDDLLLATNQARNGPDVSVISLSWGTSEFYGENELDTDLLTPARHSNEVFVAASGDDYDEQWPATSPDVLSVGGTALHVKNAGGTFFFEKPWLASGGGYSAFEAEPDYQQNIQFSGDRTTPDVSFDASPTTGVAVYDSTTYDGVRGWMELGGTSAGAPQWAGLIALADQGRAAVHQPPLDTESVLTTIYNAADSPDSDNAVFHDVWGDPVGDPPPFYVEQRFSGYGYDLLTGLGSPRGTATDGLLVNASVQHSQGSAGPFVPVSTVTGISQVPAANDAVASAAPVVNAPAAPNAATAPPAAEPEIDLGDIFSRTASVVAAGEVETVLVSRSAFHPARYVFGDGVPQVQKNRRAVADRAGTFAENAPSASTLSSSRLGNTGLGHVVSAVETSISVAVGSTLATVPGRPVGAGVALPNTGISEARLARQVAKPWATLALVAGASVALAWWWAERRRGPTRVHGS